MAVFNKGFAYLFVWVGPVPIFISEFVLLCLFVAWLILSISKKKLGFKENGHFIVPLLIIWITVGVGLFPSLILSKGDLIDSIKRSALGYYSSFTFFIATLLANRDAARKIFRWMFWGGLVALVISLPFDLSRFLPSIPILGIATTTAVAFCGLYALFMKFKWPLWSEVIAALAATQMIFSTTRSIILSFILVSAVSMGAAFKLNDFYSMWKKYLRFVVFTLVFSGIALSHYGPPPAIERFEFMRGISDFLNREKKGGGASVVAVSGSAVGRSASVQVVKFVGFVTEILAPAEVMAADHNPEPQPFATSVPDPRLKGVEVSKPVSKVATPVPPPAANLALARMVKPKPAPTKSRRFEIDESKLVLTGKTDPEIFTDYTASPVISMLDKYFFSKAGGANASWRIKVWMGGVNQILNGHFFWGKGFTYPLVIKSLSPYKDPVRFKYAVIKFIDVYSFKGRINTPGRKPSDDVIPAKPLEFTSQEENEFLTHHWYGIDFHNSHLAIFYRMGFIGFVAYAYLIVFSLIRLWKKMGKGDSLSAVCFVFIFWFLGVASFNVVLEGPFMGVIFWVLLGLVYRSTEEPSRIF